MYSGEDAAGAKVAVKVLHAYMGDAETHRRFLREAEAARRVAPFCTARVLEVGVADGRPYIVSEFITGPSLERLVRGEGVRFGSGLERLAVTTLTALAGSRSAPGARCWASCSCCGPYRAETHQATTDRPAGAPSRRSRWARTETCSPGRSGSP
ncbi:hypothetical protein [Nonomuraea sp. NPDC003709]|uniref:hypothetical protein n=1 Tax=Nonomuraea sp. NPDC003709 TaxID=3154450 RepID=UPI0033BAEF49